MHRYSRKNLIKRKATAQKCADDFSLLHLCRLMGQVLIDITSQIESMGLLILDRNGN